MQFAFHSSSINGLVEITPFFSSDQRGYFTKTFSEEVFAAHGITFAPVEELGSSSAIPCVACTFNGGTVRTNWYGSCPARSMM